MEGGFAAAAEGDDVAGVEDCVRLEAGKVVDEDAALDDFSLRCGARKAEDAAAYAVEPQALHREGDGLVFPDHGRNFAQPNRRDPDPAMADFFQILANIILHTAQTIKIRTAIDHADIPEALPLDPERHKRAEVIPVAGGAEGSRDVHSADGLRLAQRLLP